MAPGNDSQTTVVAPDLIQVESRLGRPELPPVSVGMPLRVSRIVVPVPATVIEIVTGDASDEAENTGMIHQCTQLRCMLDRTTEHCPLVAVVVSASSLILNRPFKTLDDSLDFGRGKQPGDNQIPERFENRNLLISQFDGFLLRNESEQVSC